MLNKFRATSITHYSYLFSSVSIVVFEQANVSWELCLILQFQHILSWINEVNDVNIFLGSVPGSLRSSSSSVNLHLTGAGTTGTERSFPPPTGFTYSSWICIENMPSVPSVQISVALFTVERQWEELNSKRLINSSVFLLYLDLKNRCLVVCFIVNFYFSWHTFGTLSS